MTDEPASASPASTHLDLVAAEEASVVTQHELEPGCPEGVWVVAATGEPWDGAPGVGIRWVEADA